MKNINSEGYCKNHKPKDKELKSYYLLFKWFDEQEAKGLKQSRCKECGKWLFPSEF